MAAWRRTEFDDIRVTFFTVVEAVVGLGEALAVSDHQVGAEVVVGLAGGLQRGIGGPGGREGKVSKTSEGL